MTKPKCVIEYGLRNIEVFRCKDLAAAEKIASKRKGVMTFFPDGKIPRPKKQNKHSESMGDDAVNLTIDQFSAKYGFV